MEWDINNVLSINDSYWNSEFNKNTKNKCISLKSYGVLLKNTATFKVR